MTRIWRLAHLYLLGLLLGFFIAYGGVNGGISSSLYTS